MKKIARIDMSKLFLVIFMGVFALPFLGAYLMIDEEMETKMIGGILCIIGLVIWFLFGIR